MKSNQEKPAYILADIEVFDYLKEKVGDRKTKTEAYCDLLNKSLAGFVSPFLRKQDCELRPCQCHVTVSDLAAEWHWHRATVRSFLDTLEAFGQLERTRLTKSVVITMPLRTGQPTVFHDTQENSDFAAQLREVLSGWIIGKADSGTAGEACGQLVRQAMDEAGVEDKRCPDDRVDLSLISENDDPLAVQIRATAMECVALAAMQHVLRKSKLEDILDFMDFFRFDFDGEWAPFIEASKKLAELIYDTETYGAVSDMDDDEETLKSFRKPFLSLVVRAMGKADRPETAS